MTRPSTDPHCPGIVGVDLPASGAVGEQELMVLLDIAPSAAWRELFGGHADAFIAAHGLRALGVSGRAVNAVGAMGDGRALAADLKALVHRVSRQCLQQRMVVGIGEDESAWPRPRTPRTPALLRDLVAIAEMPGVPVLLETVSRATGMRFVAIARITDDRWTACAVHDQLAFGLRPGQELDLDTTICSEIRQHRRTIFFDRASADAVYSAHPTPAMYGFESYVSVAIVRRDGSFFGTLFAFDPEPALLDAETIRTLEMLATMIGQQLVDEGDATVPPVREAGSCSVAAASGA
ncbi:GAF domain-containing protein [Xanthomonas sp. XNM01]|uniref:GAF domain-containing protein n=1 Tax=Xanthomonas sp. XNM01 TaxID=2769289 RepID=UPI00177D2421|nr:GAF domain-containing protein [Xanthomonas sp. XNM01]MBD9369767.1 GAF domain-containing protein [Xanthomonas sp. XNM01]